MSNLPSGPQPINFDPNAANAQATANADATNAGWTTGPNQGNPDPSVFTSFGGYLGGANQAANQFSANANAAQSVEAPPVSAQFTSGDQSNVSGALGGQQQAISLLQSEANGGNTQPLNQQAQQGLAQSLAQQSSLAKGAGWGSAGAAATRNAAMNGTSAAANASNSVLQQSAAQQAAAQQQLAQAQAQYTGQTQQLAGLANQNATGLTALQLQQLQANDQQTQGYQSLAQQTEQQQLAADTSQYNTQNQINTNQQAAANAANNAWKNGLTGAGIGAGAGLLMAADVKLREPGGTSGFTIREEPSFLLVRNDRTGELRKLATDPLTHEEHRQALAPHGAGPIHSYGDMPVGAPPASPPMSSAPWAPQMTLGPRGVATPMPMARTKQTAMAPMQPRTMTFADLSIGNPSSTRIGPPGMRGGDEAAHFMQTMGGPQPQPQSTMQRPLPGPAMQTPSVASRPAMPMTGAQALAAMPAGETRLQQILAAQKGGA